MESAAARTDLHYFGEKKSGGALTDRARAAENVYIQKIERERMEEAHLNSAKGKLLEEEKEAAATADTKAKSSQAEKKAER